MGFRTHCSLHDALLDDDSRRLMPFHKTVTAFIPDGITTRGACPSSPQPFSALRKKTTFCAWERCYATSTCLPRKMGDSGYDFVDIQEREDRFHELHNAIHIVAERLGFFFVNDTR